MSSCIYIIKAQQIGKGYPEFKNSYST